MNPIFRAILCDNLSAIQEMLCEKSDLIESLTENGQTPLLYAANLNRKSIILYLLLAGANPNAFFYGLTALHYASQNNDDELARLLIYNGASCNSASYSDGCTPLHYAARENAFEVIKLLCEEGADATIACTRYRMTPLQVALSGQRLPSLQVLLTYDSNRSNYLLRIALCLNSLNLVALFMREGIKAREQTPDIQEKIEALFNSPTTHPYWLMRATLTLNRSDFLKELYATHHTTYELKNALACAYAQGFLEHATAIEHCMQEIPRTLMQSHRKILTSAVSRGDHEVCSLLLARLPTSECLQHYSFFLNLAINLKHDKIATILLHHIIQNRALGSTLRNAIISRHLAAIEALLNAGAPTTEAEEFLSNNDRKYDGKVHKVLYEALRNRFIAHIKALHNPPQDSYLSLLCRDILTYILVPMVKTQRPQ